jgi:hypothetical protein
MKRDRRWSNDLRRRTRSLFLSPDDLRDCVRELLVIPALTPEERDQLEADLQALDYVDHDWWLLPYAKERLLEGVHGHIEAVVERVSMEPE